ncbi:hypothetical protein GS463_29345 [Rhodococcus hoagii]|nr:hypothetical protein [Prescottella equi]
MGPNKLLGAIQWSDNVYFYKLGELLGPERMARTASELGVGSDPASTCPASPPGSSAPRRTSPTSVGVVSRLHAVDGYRPGHVIATARAVARGGALDVGIATGALVTPQLAAADATGDDGARFPRASRSAFPSPTSSVLSAPECGPRPPRHRGPVGHAAVTAGAKTGTAEDPSAPGGLNAWFSAVVPFESPEIVVTALVRGGGFGSAHIRSRGQGHPRALPRGAAGPPACGTAPEPGA